MGSEISPSIVASYSPQTGQSFDLAGRVIQLTQLAERTDSVFTTFRYDADSRRVRRAGSVVSDSVVYDARGKAVAEVLTTHESVVYAPLGAVLQSYLVPNHETFQVDALANVSQSTQTSSGGPVHNWFAYEAASGRLVRQWDGGNDTTTNSYLDPGGMLSTANHRHYAPCCAGTYSVELRQTLNAYNAQQRLVLSRFMLDTTYYIPPAGYKRYYSQESYRYDALGRRIFTWVVRGANCPTKDQTSGCRSALTRTVWDGDQVLDEVRVQGDTTSPASVLESDAGTTDHWNGNMSYLHGPGLDQPLALWKVGESLLVLPFTNWRGVYVTGTCPSTLCTTDQVWFPGASQLLFGEPPQFQNGPPSWHGSLLESAQDASGYQYRRNRYYDPTTGRFTQEDPLGLAGGLNLYGFASGDPVNFSDPFGLCPIPREDCPRDQQFLMMMQARLAPVPSATAGFALFGITQGALGAAGDLLFGALAARAGAVVESGKLSYLLGKVAGNAASAGKGGFFEGVLGFTEKTLQKALQNHLTENLAEATVNSKGFYEVTGEMIGANGRTAIVKTVWEKTGEHTYRLITAVPH